MPAQDWSRANRTKGFKGPVDANTIPIRDVVSYFGGEVREGRSASVKCCIHSDSRRSAVINTEENLYYCHTCGKGGNAVNIIQHIENLEFKDALARALEITAGSSQPLRGKSKRGVRSVPQRTWDI